MGSALFERSKTQRLIRIIKWSAGFIPWKPIVTQGKVLEGERRDDIIQQIGP